jgi:catechol 2,3-dioxygenase-like lactoylglutathione lyase family enzyme
MLGNAKVYATIAVKDLGAAGKFYEDVLGLEVASDFPSGKMYKSGGTMLQVYESQNGGTSQATTASWETSNLDQVVDDLRQKGVRFEHYEDMPGAKLDGDIHVMGEMRAAWFRDPSGNILCVSNMKS